MTPTKPFQFYTSLGFNCEPAFQIRRHLGRDDSSLFSWAVTNPSALHAMIKTGFSELLDDQQLAHDLSIPECPMVIHGGYNWKFHAPLPPKTMTDSLQKLAYLVTKIRRPERKLFIYCTPWSMWTSEVKEVYEALIHSGDYGVDNEMVVISTKMVPGLIGSNVAPRLHFRQLNRFAPLSDAPDGHVASWNRIFDEFPHVDWGHA